MLFVIEDAWHAAWIGQFPSRSEAVAALDRLAEIAWDDPPNRAPCASSATCGRHYVLVEFDDASLPWRELTRISMLEVTGKGVSWLD